MYDYFSCIITGGPLCLFVVSRGINLSPRLTLSNISCFSPSQFYSYFYFLAVGASLSPHLIHSPIERNTLTLILIPPSPSPPPSTSPNPHHYPHPHPYPLPPSLPPVSPNPHPAISTLPLSFPPTPPTLPPTSQTSLSPGNHTYHTIPCHTILKDIHSLFPSPPQPLCHSVPLHSIPFRSAK